MNTVLSMTYDRFLVILPLHATGNELWIKRTVVQMSSNCRDLEMLDRERSNPNRQVIPRLSTQKSQIVSVSTSRPIVYQGSIPSSAIMI